MPTKRDYPVDQIRRYLETGPIALVTSAHGERRNIMTMGWHMMLQFSPALFACYIWDGNQSFDLIRRSRECVINLPTAELIDAVVTIGNSSAASGEDKFAATGLTASNAEQVAAPLISECVANFECRLEDDSQIDRYGLFIWRVVKAHVAAEPEALKTLHYRGEGLFMTAGDTLSLRPRFKPQNL